MCFPLSSKKFPGYTSENLSEKGVHEVSQRRFVLVSADHPIVSAVRYLPSTTRLSLFFCLYSFIHATCSGCWFLTRSSSALRSRCLRPHSMR